MFSGELRMSDRSPVRKAAGATLKLCSPEE
jgi:hypothetical protein